MTSTLRSLTKRLNGVACFVALAMVALMPASGASAASPEVVTFATDPTYAPFEFNKDGVLTGFDIDLIRAIAKAKGFDAKFESVPFDGIIPALQSGTYDAAVAAMVATEERRKSIDFSDPYFKTGLVIVVRDTDTAIKGETDLQGKRIAVEIGSVGSAKAKTISGAAVSTFNGSPATLLELTNGNVDAVIGDGASAHYALQTGAVRGVKVLPGLLSADVYAIGFPKGENKAELINAGLRDVIANGEYARIYEKWFGEKPPQL